MKGKKLLDGMVLWVYRPQNYTKFFQLKEKYKNFLHTDVKVERCSGKLWLCRGLRKDRIESA